MPPDSSVENATMPKFLLDENIRIEIKEFLKSNGFSAEYAAKGVSNGRLASLAKEKSLVLVSRDSDFLNKSAFPPKEFSGMMTVTMKEIYLSKQN